MKHKLIALIDQHEINTTLVAIHLLDPDSKTRESLDAEKRQSRQILESYVRNLQERADFHTFASYKKRYPSRNLKEYP